MPVVETERHGQILVVRMNRPERLNALSHEMRTLLAETWTNRGAVLSEKTREALREHAFTVFLDVDLETAWARAAETDRPLAQDRPTFARLFDDCAPRVEWVTNVRLTKK